jgi:hypothetical protein
MHQNTAQTAVVYAKYDRAGNSWDSAYTTLEAESADQGGMLFVRNEGGTIGNQLLPLWWDGTNTRTESAVITDVALVIAGGGFGMIPIGG